MKAVKMNVFISQLQSNFKRVFCVWFDTEICCLTVKRSLEVYNFEVVKKKYLEKRNKKAEQEKGKVLNWPSSTVCSIVRILRSTCKKFIYLTSQTRCPSYRLQTLLVYLAQIIVLHCQLVLLSWNFPNWSLKHFVNKKNMSNMSQVKHSSIH